MSSGPTCPACGQHVSVERARLFGFEEPAPLGAAQLQEYAGADALDAAGVGDEASYRPELAAAMAVLAIVLALIGALIVCPLVRHG